MGKVHIRLIVRAVFLGMQAHRPAQRLDKPSDISRCGLPTGSLIHEMGPNAIRTGMHEISRNWDTLAGRLPLPALAGTDVPKTARS